MLAGAFDTEAVRGTKQHVVVDRIGQVADASPIVLRIGSDSSCRDAASLFRLEFLGTGTLIRISPVDYRSGRLR